MNAPVNSDELEFRFVAGHRALDFLATLGDRHRRPIERLRAPADLDRWLELAGLPAAARATARDLTEARRLREALNGTIRAATARERPSAADLRVLNEWARRPPLAPQADRRLELRWTAQRPVQAALALVAREGAELLTGPDRELVRECAASPSCSLLFLDRSRAARRRWCEMERCGSRAKMRSYRSRTALG